MIDCEDGLINFMLYKLSDSLYFTNKIGYYYIKSKSSITSKSSDFKNRLKSNFLYFRFIFKFTKNNNIEKNIANYIFSEIYKWNKKSIIKSLKSLSSDHQFYSKTIKLYLKNHYISLKTKSILRKMKIAIIEAENNERNKSKFVDSITQ